MRVLIPAPTNSRYQARGGALSPALGRQSGRMALTARSVRRLEVAGRIGTPPGGGTFSSMSKALQSAETSRKTVGVTRWLLAALVPCYLVVQRHEHNPPEGETVLGFQFTVLNEHVNLLPEGGKLECGQVTAFLDRRQVVPRVRKVGV